MKAAVREREPRATSVSTAEAVAAEMAATEMAAKVTATMASAAMTSPAMTSATMASAAASAERDARHYGRENNDDNSDAGFRHGTLAAPASLLH